jgi:hypothetical protein
LSAGSSVVSVSCPQTQCMRELTVELVMADILSRRRFRSHRPWHLLPRPEQEEATR